VSGGGGRAARTPLVHHELCFGCGRVNLFGLLLEVQETAPGMVAGRCFLKQDHQGPDRGSAHDGVLAAALAEAMALACGVDARTITFDVSVVGAAPIGAFLELEARVERRNGQTAYATATATTDRRMVGHARGSFRS
jgi:acyl-coenzyme A thioesterase PaaI-like protein